MGVHVSKTCLGKWFKILLKRYLGKLLCDSVCIWFNLNELTWKVWLWTQFKHGGGLADLEDFHTTCDIIWTAAALAIGWRISFVRLKAMGALWPYLGVMWKANIFPEWFFSPLLGNQMSCETLWRSFEANVCRKKEEDDEEAKQNLVSVLLL